MMSVLLGNSMCRRCCVSFWNSLESSVSRAMVKHRAVVFYQDSNGTVLHPVLLANMIRTRPDLRTVFKGYGLGVRARDYE